MDDHGRVSRRDVCGTALAFLTGAAAAWATARQAAAQEKVAQEKLAQDVVQYQAMPKDGARCDACVNWVPPNACKIVAGTIKPEGWCIAFAPKEG